MQFKASVLRHSSPKGRLSPYLDPRIYVFYYQFCKDLFMRQRPRYEKQIVTALARNPACVILGPRQCGKTTLAQQIASSRKVVHYFDLERASSQAQLAHPETVLGVLSGLVVIDEIQRQPSLFAALRPLLDRRRSAAKFLLLGSASPDIVRGVSETLAGRIGFVDISGFDITEIPPADWRKLWLRGGFPRSLLARNNNASVVSLK